MSGFSTVMRMMIYGDFLGLLIAFLMSTTLVFALSYFLLTKYRVFEQYERQKVIKVLSSLLVGLFLGLMLSKTIITIPLYRELIHMILSVGSS